MTGSKHNLEGNSGDRGESNPGPYWKRMHRDWRFWVGRRLHVCGACGLRAERRFGVGSAWTSATAVAHSYRELSVPLASTFRR